jgi:molybdopterin-guanine dinucleotide biosynthesis protein A
VADRGLTGILLVGGASSRFGSPKALARLDGETLAERAWRLLGEACDERLAVGKAGELELPFAVLDDGSDVRAPIAGVVAGLRAAAHDVCIVLPVDTPLVTAALLRELGEACADAAVTPSGPLPGAFHRRTLPEFELALASSDLSLRAVLKRLYVEVVDADATLVADVDTRADLVALAARL